jgi:hypothetical protein
LFTVLLAAVEIVHNFDVSLATNKTPNQWDVRHSLVEKTRAVDRLCMFGRTLVARVKEHLARRARQQNSLQYETVHAAGFFVTTKMGKVD